MTEDERKRLERFIADRAHAQSVRITRIERMSGGAVQQNWALDADIAEGPYSGPQRWVLRIDAPASVGESLTRMQEFAVLCAMRDANVLAPKPLWCCDETAVLGRAFFIMERLPGIASGHRVARDPAIIPDRRALARELAVNLARIHAVQRDGRLGFLKTHLARDNIARHREYLDTLPDTHAALEWGLRWCELNAPQKEEVTFIHGDYRTGNYLVHEGRLAGVLDWEFCAFGNPLQDVGWIFAKCWRMGQNHFICGGVADPEDFLDAYTKASGREIDAFSLRYWQVMAHLRWAVIALQQRERHRSGIEPSLELALTGHIVSDLELEVLALTEETA